MYRSLFTIPVLLATALLVLHSWLYRGPRNTKIFWGVGYLLAFFREVIYQNFFNDTYRFTGTQLKVLNVPITVPMGWLFEAYISLYIAQFMLGTDVRTMRAGKTQITPADYGKHVLPVLCLSAVITSTITVAIENIAVRMHWWQMMNGTYDVNPGWVQGHMLTVFWLLTLLTYLTHEPLRLKRNLVYVALVWAFNAGVELGFLGYRAAINPALTIVVWGLIGAYLVFVIVTWRQLLIYFVVSMPLATACVMGPLLAAPSLGLGEYKNFLAFVSEMTLLSVYAFYLWRTQRPAQPIVPADLL